MTHIIQEHTNHEGLSNAFALRPSNQDDFEFMWQLERTTMRDYVLQTWGVWDDEVQKKKLQENFGVVWQPQIVLVNGESAGAFCMEEKEDCMFISSLNILPNYQGQGLGTKILCDVLRQGKEHGLPVTLRVLKVNPARKLYERWGFKIYEETETHYRMKVSQ